MILIQNFIKNSYFSPFKLKSIGDFTSLQFNPSRNAIEFGASYLGSFHQFSFNTAGDKVSLFNESSVTYNEIDYLYGLNYEYMVYKGNSEPKMNIYNQDKSMSLPNPIDETWTNYDFKDEGDINLSSENDQITLSYLGSGHEILTLSSVSNPNFPNSSLVSSEMNSCTQYLLNPFGRSASSPYSFTHESTQDVEISSPFWTDPGSGTGEVKILELDGTEVNWLSIDPSTGKISGKAPQTQMNYTFNVELKFPSGTLTVPFYLNIRKWEFSNWKIWSLESWIECLNGYQYDETNGTCKEDGNKSLK